MSAREILFIVNIIGMILSVLLAWRVIFAPLDLKHMRTTVLAGLFILFMLRVFSVTFATLVLGPPWQS